MLYAYLFGALFLGLALIAGLMRLFALVSTRARFASRAATTTKGCLALASSSTASPQALPQTSWQPPLAISLQGLFTEWDIRRGDHVNAPGETYSQAVVCVDGEYVWTIPFDAKGYLILVPRKYPKKTLPPIGSGVSWFKPS